jgi:DNA replication protein DnaC
MFYADGPGGTGKTFLLSAIIDDSSLKNIDFRVVAASGVAAQLLKTGQTAHSTFNIPIHLHPDAEC